MAANCNTKKVRISLIGSSGKMGQMVQACVLNDPEVEICSDGDVVIDFSSAEGTKKAIALEKPLVCGTTGLDEEIFASLEALSKKVPVLYSPNFSLGIALCFEMLESCAGKIKEFAQVDVDEVHNSQKKDTPSGTALRLAELTGAENISHQRIDRQVFKHQVKIRLNSEVVTLSHEAFSRDVYALGALAAAKFILHQSPKLYSLKDIFY